MDLRVETDPKTKKVNWFAVKANTEDEVSILTHLFKAFQLDSRRVTITDEEDEDYNYSFRFDGSSEYY